MRQDFIDGGYEINIVAINAKTASASKNLYVGKAGFDLLQDTHDADVWTLMGGGKDDFFIYREGGTLAPSGYLPMGGEINTDLSTPEGYNNVFNAVIEADKLGPGERSCVENHGGLILPGDLNQDRTMNLSDAVFLLVQLFNSSGTESSFPCGDGSITDEGNILLADMNQDGSINVADVVAILSYLFKNGPSHGLGTECVPITGCPGLCGEQ